MSDYDEVVSEDAVEDDEVVSEESVEAPDDGTGGAVSLISDEAKALLIGLLDARDEVETLEAQLKTAKENLDEVEMDVYEMFEASGIDGTLPVDLGPPYGKTKFRTRETHYAKIVDKKTLTTYYEERGDLEDVRTEPKFKMADLNTEVRELIDNHQSLPPGLTYRSDRGMTITRQK